MQLTEAQILQFQSLFKRKFGKDISTEQAIERGMKLLRLTELIYKPMTVINCEDVQRRVCHLKNTPLLIIDEN